MEALWKMEEQWNLSTRKTAAIFACAAVLLIGMCVAAGAWRRRRRESVHQEPCTVDQEYERRSRAVEMLLESVRWSRRRRRSKWEESSVRESSGSGSGSGSERETPTPLLVKRELVGGGQSHNSTAAVWQRPILMGEKCELPRFSGLILYDQTGIPLQQGIIYKQEMMPTPVARTTLKDLL